MTLRPLPGSTLMAQALARRIIVDGDEISLGQFLEQLEAYGDQRVREATEEGRTWPETG